MACKLQMIKVAQSEVRGPEVFWMSGWERWHTLCFMVAVIRHAGKIILVNTGPPCDLTAINHAWVDYCGDPRAALRVEPDERLECVLPQIGIQPDQVDIVILTPLQVYSVGGVPLFRNAQICISRRGWSAFHAPRHKIPHEDRHLTIPDNILTHLCTEGWDRVRLLEPEETVLPGVRTFWTGAHHPESTAIAVDTDGGVAILADCMFYYENIEQDRLLGIAENHEQCKSAYERIRREADILIPLYDPRVFDRHPGGVVG